MDKRVKGNQTQDQAFTERSLDSKDHPSSKSEIVQQIVSQISHALSVKRSVNFFESLVDKLTMSLGVDYALIGQVQSSKRGGNQLQTLAVSCKGQTVENFTLSLAGTPCENINHRSSSCYSRRVRERFPSDPLLRKYHIEAYACVPLLDANEHVIGLIILLSKTPFHDEFLVKSVLDLFSIRASLELERKHYEEKMRQLAYQDELTGLPNRNRLMEHLDQAIAHAQQQDQLVALLFVDMDRFSRINEAEGYDNGDMLLQQVAHRLISYSAEGEYIARIYGDKFGIVLTGIVNQQEITRKAETVLDLLKKPFFVQHNEYFLQASIGISVYPLNGEQGRQLFKLADQALSNAKKHFGNTYQYYSSLDNMNISEYVTLEQKLHKALEFNQFELHFQPQLNIHDKHIVGWEALLRWYDPQSGYISPQTFIPLIEDLGLIIPIGYWVIEQACDQLKRFERLGMDKAHMMINLSPHQLLQHNFVEMVREIIEKKQVDPARIGFEITENISLFGVQSALNVLCNLKQLGVKVAIDDFGKGYSSFSYLKQFPIDIVKIDRSFVKDINADQYSLAICRSIIDVCHSLNFTVLAEGVERPEQLEVLDELGCSNFQGFLYSKPLPAHEAEGYMMRVTSPDGLSNGRSDIM